ncbi:hypothetical protein [Pseudalkalibacillus caeni]|uniref:Nucleotidyltransferase n=1 Tax=Exobacillus caeni TaxID=2574798 RepID=A0A5R9F9J6_9BACL|nr:hypothetical protein [Pseudalkalibacillus caeni]TLS38308.1 hypothetical protein FCL54_07220 [Pseudalkalibacillus caeni]
MIKELGSYWKIDNEGYIENEAHPNKISSDHKSAVEDVINEYKKQLGSDLHSIYIFGTVARGNAVEEVSDLNSFALTSGDVSDTNQWAEQVTGNLECMHPYFSGIDMDVFCIEDVLKQPDKFNRVSFALKSDGACVYGEDLSQTIKPFRQCAAVANHEIIQFRDKIEDAQRYLDRDLSKKEYSKYCRQAMKSLVRTGFSLVMIQEGKFTKDILPGYYSFAKYYPHKKQDMRKAVEFVIQPPEQVEQAVELLDSFGSFLINACDNWLDLNNRDRKLALEI